MTANSRNYGGPVDPLGVDVLGTSAAPVALGVADTYVAQTGITDTRGMDVIAHYVKIPTLDGTATKIVVKVEWSDDGTDLHQQGAEAVSGGTITIEPAEFEYAVGVAPFTLPVIPLPVIANYCKVSVKADLGITTTAHVRAKRLA